MKKAAAKDIFLPGPRRPDDVVTICRVTYRTVYDYRGKKLFAALSNTSWKDSIQWIESVASKIVK